jgi:hypothetical protein
MDFAQVRLGRNGKFRLRQQGNVDDQLRCEVL